MSSNLRLPACWPAPAKLVEWEIGPELLHKLPLAIFSRTPDEPRVGPIVDRMAELRGCRLPRHLVERLRVEHEPVHVEDDCSDFRLHRSDCLSA
jgi:hypothetical protein